jgi:hypothetical protein
MNVQVEPAPGDGAATAPPAPPKPAPPPHNADYAKAFARAQAKFKPVKRTREVLVKTSGGGFYSFQYAPLDEILAATLPALNAEGFSLSQRIGRGESGDYIETTLLHETGERKNQVPIFVTGQGAQQYASGVTYARRYGVTLILCIAAEEDDDANEADRNKLQDAPKAPTKPAKAKGRQVVLDEGESRHTAPMAPAFAVPAVSGSAAGKPKQTSWVDNLPDPIRTGITGAELKEPEGDAMVAAEGKVADAIQEFHEAAIEGRRVGIEQIWAEIRGDEYVATQTWRRLKEQHPDSWAVVNEVLKPKPTQKGKRNA